MKTSLLVSSEKNRLAAILNATRRVAFIGLLLLFAFNSRSQDLNTATKDEVPQDPDSWQFIVSPYLWMPFSVEGDSTVNGSTASLDLDLDDVLDMISFGLSGRVEAWKKDWGVILDGSYVSLEGDQKTPFTKIDADIAESIFDLLGSRRFKLTSFSEDKQDMALFFEAQAGGRYHYLKQEIDLSPGPNLGKSKDWLEPVVGARVTFQMTKKFAIMARGDAGGFGIGSASDSTLNGMIGTSYRFRDNMDLRLGYKIQDIDYSNGSGSNEFGWDATLHGPYLAAGIWF